MHLSTFLQQVQHVGGRKQPSNNIKFKQLNIHERVMAAQEQEGESSVSRQQVIDEDYGKIFVGGISSDTTEDSLKQYMEKHGGEVEKVELKYDRVTNRMRGFGFVKFKDEASVNKILESGPHVVDGKRIDPKKAEKQVKASAIRTKKIFVGGLKPETTEERLREYFGSFGQIQQVEFISERDDSTKRRGFCFIEFDNEDVVDKLVKKQFHEVATKTVEVKHAYSKEQQAQLAAKGLWFPGGRGRGRGFGMGVPGAGFGYYDQSMAFADPYGLGYGAGMMGYGAAVAPYGGGITYPTIDYSGWAGRGGGVGGRGSSGIGPVFSLGARNSFHPYSR